MHVPDTVFYVLGVSGATFLVASANQSLPVPRSVLHQIAKVCVLASYLRQPRHKRPSFLRRLHARIDAIKRERHQAATRRLISEPAFRRRN